MEALGLTRKEMVQILHVDKWRMRFVLYYGIIVEFTSHRRKNTMFYTHTPCFLLVVINVKGNTACKKVPSGS